MHRLMPSMNQQIFMKNITPLCEEVHKEKKNAFFIIYRMEDAFITYCRQRKQSLAEARKVEPH